MWVGVSVCGCVRGCESDPAQVRRQQPRKSRDDAGVRSRSEPIRPANGVCAPGRGRHVRVRLRRLRVSPRRRLRGRANGHVTFLPHDGPSQFTG